MGSKGAVLGVQCNEYTNNVSRYCGKLNNIRSKEIEVGWEETD